MMVAEKATAPVSTAPCSEQNNQAESITPEPSPATCGLCGSLEDLYFASAGALCLGCFASVVSVAACDLWPDMVSYTAAFETAVLM